MVMRAKTQMSRDTMKGPPSAGWVRWYTKYCWVNTPPISVPRPMRAASSGVQRTPVATMPATMNKATATINSGMIKASVASRIVSNSVANPRAEPINVAMVSLPSVASG